jgi:hypothetical protein
VPEQPTDPDSPRRPDAPRRPADRYGDRPPRSRRAVVVTLAPLAAAFMAWVVWAGLGAADRDVRWTDVGFRVVGDDRVEVTFDVVKDPDVSARCTVTALSAGYATVGIATVDVGPAPDRAVRTSTTVRTQERAVTGVVDECQVL